MHCDVVNERFTGCLLHIMVAMCSICQMVPEIQFVQGTDGRPSGDAYVTFASRLDAERVLGESGRKLIGNRLVDMQMI